MDVMSIADARSRFSGLVARFRDAPDTEPVTIGSHRKPEAVLLSAAAYRRLSGVQKSGVSLDQLRKLQPIIRHLARAARLGDVRVFGSVARGEQRADSDVDLLVAAEVGATMFDIAQFEIDMEVLLGVPVSAISVASLDPERDATILAESVPL